jgi:hypothetical protein
MPKIVKKSLVNAAENPQLSMRISPYLDLLIKEAAVHDDRDLAPWVRLMLEIAAKHQLKLKKR